MSDLNAMLCTPCQSKTVPLSTEATQVYLQQIQQWELNDANTEINRTFRFKDHYQTIAFVNAMAWISHREDHHPISEVGYN